jgi:hypothetical protein
MVATREKTDWEEPLKDYISKYYKSLWLGELEQCYLDEPITGVPETENYLLATPCREKRRETWERRSK